MMKTWIVPVALGLVALTAAQSPAIAQRGIGPEPGWELYERLARDAVSGSRSNAEWRFDHDYTAGYWTAADGNAYEGYWTCGYIKGIDSKGSARDWSPFVVVVRHNRVVFSEVGSPKFFNSVNAKCDEAKTRGIIVARNSSGQILPGAPQMGTYEGGVRPAGRGGYSRNAAQPERNRPFMPGVADSIANAMFDMKYAAARDGLRIPRSAGAERARMQDCSRAW
tara:strand:+ start:380 stop:1048 length:669 start_codon:yes stop_codon:yes gene_type:complete